MLGPRSHPGAPGWSVGLSKARCDIRGCGYATSLNCTVIHCYLASSHQRPDQSMLTMPPTRFSRVVWTDDCFNSSDGCLILKIVPKGIFDSPKSQHTKSVLPSDSLPTLGNGTTLLHSPMPETCRGGGWPQFFSHPIFSSRAYLPWLCVVPMNAG